MNEYIAVILTALNVFGFWLKFILDEKRARRKERAERLIHQEPSTNEKSALPPRKVTHSKH
ncbi:hypothetical protein [Paenibacillus faecalis]|uniref:hypothetical protein n=1 Tax=Paenibacillus faecalis TaxID=2079532 RepID=UPI000D112192|nr:hypothetical protein [Paenibacillus faecalis]